MHVEAVGKPSSRVLVAEDDPHLRRLISHHLSRDGHTVVEAATGYEALELLGKHAVADTELAAIVMDVRMPGHSGLNILRGLGELAKRTPIFMITAFGDDEVHRLAVRWGARAVLDKPFEMEALRGLVRGGVKREPAGRDAAADAYASDRMLLERYLEVVNRARAQRTYRLPGASRTTFATGPLLLRVVGAMATESSLFVLEWRQPYGFSVTKASDNTAVVRCEVSRAHLEAVISAPWHYLAHPEHLALWF